jgi:hypothetical protein
MNVKKKMTKVRADKFVSVAVQKDSYAVLVTYREKLSKKVGFKVSMTQAVACMIKDAKV